jgi:hypothetical protein
LLGYITQVLVRQEISRKLGYAIQADEELLRVQLEALQGQLNAPTQFKVRYTHVAWASCRIILPFTVKWL